MDNFGLFRATLTPSLLPMRDSFDRVLSEYQKFWNSMRNRLLNKMREFVLLRSRNPSRSVKWKDRRSSVSSVMEDDQSPTTAVWEPRTRFLTVIMTGLWALPELVNALTYFFQVDGKTEMKTAIFSKNKLCWFSFTWILNAWASSGIPGFRLAVLFLWLHYFWNLSPLKRSPSKAHFNFCRYINRTGRRS